jgi:hypothetical protein
MEAIAGRLCRAERASRALDGVIAGPAVEPHLGAVLTGDDPEAVVLDFMQYPFLCFIKEPAANHLSGRRT